MNLIIILLLLTSLVLNNLEFDRMTLEKLFKIEACLKFTHVNECLEISYASTEQVSQLYLFNKWSSLCPKLFISWIKFEPELC
jgi:hypothetical protein